MENNTPVEEDEYMSFEELCRGEIGMNPVAATHYLFGTFGKPNFGKGVRFHPRNPGAPEKIRIHAEDAAAFAEKVITHREGSRT